MIAQTRNNIILIRYNKADQKDIKGHMLQKLFDQVFISPPLNRLTLDQFVSRIRGNKLGIAQEFQQTTHENHEFNPQVQILHQSVSSNDPRGQQIERPRTEQKQNKGSPPDKFDSMIQTQTAKPVTRKQ